MQMPQDMSPSCDLEVPSEQEPFANGLFSFSSNLNVFGKYKRLLSPALIPIKCPKDTLLSLKNDAVDWLLQHKKLRS
ncbi:hypothetical protein TSUD_64110 [Trifolium subterraneum]|uniref:Uncharacterized protein n=1 Tax=Trifolium subterraneum TaxID=3900 RepID=A0A2Z6MLV7_TRISU|nr:hypothetical protein TSUD_64110 [Trifolium subterraneum]